MLSELLFFSYMHTCRKQTSAKPMTFSPHVLFFHILTLMCPPSHTHTRVCTHTYILRQVKTILVAMQTTYNIAS